MISQRGLWLPLRDVLYKTQANAFKQVGRRRVPRAFRRTRREDCLCVTHPARDGAGTYALTLGGYSFSIFFTAFAKFF